MDNVGRDKYTQYGDSSKITVDNRANKKDGFWKNIWITVVASLIVATLVALWNLFIK